MSAPQWTVVDIGLAQMGDMRALFQGVFGHELSERMWRWKYDEGHGVAVGARAPSGELLAHYGGTFRTISFFGRPALAVQIGDVMVAREGRAMLSHKGPFGMVMQAFLKQHISTKNGPVLGFGFPNARAMRLGVLLGEYVQVDTIHELSWSVNRPANDWRAYFLGTCVQEVDWNDSTTISLVDEVWRLMQRDLAGFVVPLRDANWWKHRYANHPEHKYQCFLIRSRWSRRTLGVIALRAHMAASTSKSEAEVWELMDWVSAAKNTHAMLQAARAVVFENGGTSLMGWFSGTVKAQFPDATSQEVCAVSVTAPNNDGKFSLGHELACSAAALMGKWWLTSGDTDFR